MKLLELAASAGLPVNQVEGDREVLSITHDSRLVKPGALFAAFPGMVQDGRRFIPEAIRRGAVACMGLPPRVPELPIPYLPSKDPRRAAALMASALHGNPSQQLVLAGITGTSGKTTTSLLVDAILRRVHQKTGLAGTLVYRAAREVEASRTTPEATDLQKLLAELRASGGTAMTLECSSHALALDRLTGCSFDAAVFLNLSRDHLDFHQTLDEYFAAKCRLFGMVKSRGTRIANFDSDFGKSTASKTGFPVEGFTLAGAPGSRFLGHYQHEGEKTRVRVEDRSTGVTVHVEPVLLGRPNAENILAAIATGLALGIDPVQIKAGIESVSSVPGRLEKIAGNGLKNVSVFVDYAHKPGALEGVLKTARELMSPPESRLLLVFGCGGDRDRGKRPEMGEIASRLADETILTSDNPRSEDPLAILHEIESGFANSGKLPVVIADREQAIATAIKRARPGDLVLIAGKGHETYQEIAGRKIPFDDRTTAARYLSDLEVIAEVRR